MSGHRSIRGLAAASLAALVLAGCGNTPSTQLSDRLTSGLRSVVQGGGEAPAEPTRAQINEAPFAVIAARREGATRRAYMPAVSADGDYVTYYVKGARSITLHGGAIVAHRGLSYDLMSMQSSPDDPLVTATPLADWPKSVTRAYQMRGGDEQIYTRSVVCTPTHGDEVQKVEIKEIVFDLVEVEDHCRNGQFSFTNRYWVAPDTGYVWKSVQWTGPKMFPIMLEIMRPYAAS